MAALCRSVGYSDIDNTGNGKLVVVDYRDSTDTSRAPNAELKVWKGTMVVQKRQLLGMPCGIATFNMDESEGGSAATAVACEDAVYIYVNLKAYAKFIVPPVPLNEEVGPHRRLLAPFRTPLTARNANLPPAYRGRLRRQLSIESLSFSLPPPRFPRWFRSLTCSAHPDPPPSRRRRAYGTRR